jgi:hypothetical protein
MSTVSALSVYTCGSEIDTKNTAYHTRFQVPYDTWIKRQLGADSTASTTCWNSCLSPSPTTSTEVQGIPLPVVACGKCIRALTDEAHQAAARKGGGCHVCVNVVAPWTHQRQNTTLPTATELQLFLRDNTYSNAYQTFQTLPACERAEWIRTVCGGNTEREYRIPLEGETTHDASGTASEFTVGEIIGIAIGSLCVLLLVIGFIVWLMHQRDLNQQLDNQRIQMIKELQSIVHQYEDIKTQHPPLESKRDEYLAKINDLAPSAVKILRVELVDSYREKIRRSYEDYKIKHQPVAPTEPEVQDNLQVRRTKTPWRQKHQWNGGSDTDDDDPPSAT